MKKTIAAYLEDNPVFATFMSLIKFSELYRTLDSTNSVTVFAPQNIAFEKLGGAGFSRLINESRSKLKRIMEYHILDGIHKSKEMIHGSRIQTLNGNDVTIYNKEGAFKINDSVVDQKDIVLQNGVLHIIDKIL